MPTAVTNCKKCHAEIKAKGRTEDTAQANLQQAVANHMEDEHGGKPRPRVPEFEAMAAQEDN